MSATEFHLCTITLHVFKRPPYDLIVKKYIYLLRGEMVSPIPRKINLKRTILNLYESNESGDDTKY